MIDVSSYELYYEDAEMAVIDMRGKLKANGRFSKRKQKPMYSVVHHTAGNFTDFPTGLYRSNDFCREIRGWAKIPYHLYIPYSRIEYRGKPAIVLCNSFDRRTWHTYGGNNVGIGVVCQGNFSFAPAGEYDSRMYNYGGSPSDVRVPSVFQQDAMHWTHDWLCEKFELEHDSIKGHFDFTKRHCPGWWLEGFVDAYQRGFGPLYTDEFSDGAIRDGHCNL